MFPFSTAVEYSQGFSDPSKIAIREKDDQSRQPKFAAHDSEQHGNDCNRQESVDETAHHMAHDYFSSPPPGGGARLA